MIVKRFGCTTIHKKRYINASSFIHIHLCIQFSFVCYVNFIGFKIKGKKKSDIIIYSFRYCIPTVLSLTIKNKILYLYVIHVFI